MIQKIESNIHKSHPNVKIYIVPSPNDIMAMPVLPQPAYSVRNAKINQLGNPNSILLNEEINVGCVNGNVIFNLLKESSFKGSFNRVDKSIWNILQ